MNIVISIVSWGPKLQSKNYLIKSRSQPLKCGQTECVCAYFVFSDLPAISDSKHEISTVSSHVCRFLCFVYLPPLSVVNLLLSWRAEAAVSLLIQQEEVSTGNGERDVGSHIYR